MARENDETAKIFEIIKAEEQEKTKNKKRNIN